MYVPEVKKLICFYKMYFSPTGASTWPIQCLERMSGLHNFQALAAPKGLVELFLQCLCPTALAAQNEGESKFFTKYMFFLVSRTGTFVELV